MEPSSNTALLVIDVQEGMRLPDRGARNNPQAEENIARLLDAWRAAGRPIIHVKHNSRWVTSPFHATHAGNAVQAFAKPVSGEPLIEKDVNCAFVGTDLESRLRSAGVETVVIVGFVTNHCVDATARMAGDLQFDTYVVSDATGTFDRVGPDGHTYEAATIHAVSLASLNGEFATVVDTDKVLSTFEALTRS
jgi:nicotinamidase-related amidase